MKRTFYLFEWLNTKTKKPSVDVEIAMNKKDAEAISKYKSSVYEDYKFNGFIKKL